MRVLTVHNRYQQPGGEDAVFANEAALLRSHGCEVEQLEVSNAVIHTGLLSDQVGLALNTIWSRSGYRLVKTKIEQFKPSVVHFHNTFPLISPAAYYAARASGVPVVQTLHNYRLLCPNALFFRDGHPCETCLGKTPPWPGVLHRCYRGSRSATAAVTAMTAVHRWLGTWRSMVDVYVALTEFARQKFVQGGLPADRLLVKPNFLNSDPGPGQHGGGFALFVGRLTEEKGISTLLKAWDKIRTRCSLKIVGDGPLADYVAERAQPGSGVEWLGAQPKDRVIELMKEAQFLLFPSVWYEGFPMVLVEALAVGLPVICSDLGSMATLVKHDATGLLCSPGDPEQFAKRVVWALDNPQRLKEMGLACRQEYEERYTPTRSYDELMKIYHLAIANFETRNSFV